MLISSAFIGLDQNGQIKVREIGIRFDPEAEKLGTPKILVDNQLWDITGQIAFKIGGHNEIAYEFSVQSSERARIEAEHWALEMTKHSGEDPDVLNAIHLVNVSKTYAPAEWGIGGPVDVAEMIPKVGVRWIHRKPECPAQGVN